MAKLITQTIVIEFNKIVKETDTTEVSLYPADMIATLEQVAQELVDQTVVVEVLNGEGAE